MPVYILEMENKVTKCIIFVIPKTKTKKKSLTDGRDRHTGSVNTHADFILSYAVHIGAVQGFLNFLEGSETALQK